VTTSVWDTPDLRSAGDYIKFEKIGDTISGTVTAIRVQRWDDGSVSPQLFLTTDDGEEKTLTAGQVRLKVALAEKRPEAGDHVTITLTDLEQRGGGKTLKHFDVQVVPGGGKAPATPLSAATGTPVAAAPVDAQAAAAALANLTPEQRAAIGLA
jgi:hypothetical protein